MYGNADKSCCRCVWILTSYLFDCFQNRDISKLSPRKRVSLMGRMKKPDANDADSMKLLSANTVSSSTPYDMQKSSSTQSSLPTNELTKLYSEFSSLRKSYCGVRIA